MAEHNPSDKVGGQHWTTVRELWMRKDKEQCESWRDEVQNILIFSGLFSAIVTAFLIESQKALRPDPAEQSVQLLMQIAAQSAGQSWVTQSEPRIVRKINICVNVFWFLSLVLSLTAALIGIVSLQWIRTHTSTMGDGSESLGLSHMHSLGLQKSYIPHIFTSLPIILIIGLTFFFVGLIAFLFELSLPVAIPAAVAIGLTFGFLLVTTLHPLLQSWPLLQSLLGKWLSYNFPSPYRSPQSLSLFRQKDWVPTSRIWLQQRQKDFAVEKKQLSHLERRPEGLEAVFAYDTIKALAAVKESKSAESENAKTALAKCLAEVLPIYLDLDLFTTGDLADLIPFLPPSEFVPSALLSRDNLATREDLNAVALVQIATCKGQPSQTSALVKASVLTTRFLFERPRILNPVPNSQPLRLISKPDELTPDVLEMLIGTLTQFFSFAADFHPDNESITTHTMTHTSSYTYWFLVLSAEILTECSLPKEMQARHTYLLAMIADRLDEDETRDYLFLTASIYASVISKSSVMCSSPFGGDFLGAVMRHRDRFKGNMNHQQSQLRRAIKANEVTWGSIDRALKALESSNTALVPNPTGANDITTGPHPGSCAYGEGRQSSGQSRDRATPGGISTLDHGGGSNSSGSWRKLDGEVYEGRLDIIIDAPSSGT